MNRDNTARDTLGGLANAHPADACEIVGLVLDFARETAIDELDVERFVVVREGSYTMPLVAVRVPERQFFLSADTGRHVALLLSGMNRNGMAVALMEACDQAEAYAHRLDGRAH